MKFSCLEIAKAADLHPGRQSGGEQLFRCPRHNDEHPSLSVNAAKDVFLCGPCGTGGTAWQFAAFLAGVDPSDKSGVRQWLHEHGLGGQKQENHAEPAPSSTRSIVETYPYTDENNALLFEVVRYQPKDFKQRRPNGNGGWIWSLGATRLVLYRLRDVLDAGVVYIVEGEKDADSLRSLGLTATCNPHGAGKWRAEYSKFFKLLQQVVIIPDNDEPGREHARGVAESLHGRVLLIKILELPDLPPKGDVSDWLAAGGTPEQLTELVASTIEFKYSTTKVPDAMDFTSMEELLNESEEEARWLVEDRLPMGGLSLIVAKPKVGKSTLARQLALAIARGDDFLGFKTVQGTVLYLALEEKRSEIRRHFQAMGAEASDPIYVFCAQSPKDALEKLRAAIKTVSPVLVIVDPLFRFSRITDVNDYIQVTNALEPLVALARTSGSHLLAVHHEGKRSGADGDSVLGSTAIYGSVDSLLTMKRSDRYRTVSSKQRYGADLEETVLQYDPETRTLSAGALRVDEDVDHVGIAIVEYLGTQPDAVDESCIQSAVQAKHAKQQKALRKLVDEVKVIRTGGGKKGDKYLYQIASTPVPPIYAVPENFDPPNPISASLVNANSGTEPSLDSQSIDETPEPALKGTKERL